MFDSPTGWVAKHIRNYTESDGEKGHLWRGYPTLLLTTRGRNSGKLRRTALIYGKDNGCYIIVGSRGGHDKHPAWYLNLQKTPQVEVQVVEETFTAHARTASDEEKARLWPLMLSIYPRYEGYQAKTTRAIPIVVLEPVTE